MGVNQRKGRIVADGADVAEMIGDPLQFRHHAAQHGGARRNVNRERRLDGAGKRKAERDRRVPGHPRHHPCGRGEIDIGQESVDPLVHIAEPRFQPRHRLAVGGEAEMAGLDDARVNGTHGDLVKPMALHGQKIVSGRIAQRRRRSGPERRAKRCLAPPLAVIEPDPIIGRVSGCKTVEIRDGAFEPDGGRMKAADRREDSALDRKRNHARISARRAQRHVDRAGIAPKTQKIAGAIAERFGQRDPHLGIDIEAPPWPVIGRGCEPAQDGGDRVGLDCVGHDRIGAHRRHPSKAATPRNHCTTGPGSQTPATSASERCT